MSERSPWSLLRHASEADLGAIVAIYNATIPSRQVTADTAPVSVASKLGWFQRHSADRHPILVHESDGQVAAWVSLQPFYGRPAYDATAEVSIYVADAYRGRGLGRQLLREVMAASPQLGVSTLLGFVFSHNAPSLRLFQREGFVEWGRLPGIAQMDGREYSLSIVGRRVA